jgi:hypothetical protein
MRHIKQEVIGPHREWGLAYCGKTQDRITGKWISPEEANERLIEAEKGEPYLLGDVCKKCLERFANDPYYK